MTLHELTAFRNKLKIAHDALVTAKEYTDADTSYEDFLPTDYDQILADLSQSINTLTHAIGKLKEKK